jgi:hypothetical protein
VGQFGPPGYCSGSTNLIEFGSNPDPKHCAKLVILHLDSKKKRKSSPHPLHPHSPDSRDRPETSRPPPSAGCSVRTWQAICKTAEQQLASYLKNRPPTIGNLSAIPPRTIGKLSAIPPSNNWQAICNTAQQQLASYLQYRPATISNLAAIPEIQLASVTDPSHFF